MWKRLGDLGQVLTGYPFRGKVVPEEGGDLAVLQIKDVSAAGKLDLSDALRIHNTSGYSKHLLRSGDVLMQLRGTQHPAVVFNDALSAIAALGLLIIRPRLDVIQPEFLYWYLNHPKTQQQLRDLARGSTVAFIAKSDVEEFQIHVPPIELQIKLIAVNRLRQQERNLAMQLDQLRGEYIDSLMWQVAASNQIQKV